jgi:putative redox protein
MKVFLDRVNKDVHFSIRNEDGNNVEVDGSPEMGGAGLGVRPTELLLMGAASCSAIDVIAILRKMKQPLEDIQVAVDGDKQQEIPKVFVKIHMHYTLTGDLKKEKVARAIELSVTKYCTVSRMLDKTAEITTSFEIIPSANT